MKLRHLKVPVLLAAGSVAAFSATEAQETKLRFGHVATKAVANFRSADSIEERLRADGMTLHPQLVALRLRIESALDEIEEAIGKGELAAANETLVRASALVDRFARQIGGE